MRTVRALATAGLSILVLVACASGGSGRFSEGVAPDYAPEYDSVDAGSVQMGSQEYVPGYAADREIITTGSLTLLTDEVSVAVEGIIELVEEDGGWVDSRYHATATEYRDESAQLTVRVRAAELNETIGAIEQFGKAQDLQVHSEDVTQYARDLDARIGALETSTERLIELMATADTSEALIAAESALSDRQGELESLRSERNYLSGQVAMSTLEISLISPAQAEFDAGGFLGGVKKGWNGLVTAASGALVAVGVALPWVAVIGIPVSVIVWLRRRRRKVATVKSSP